ncbi:MAG: hypothetical protein ACPGNV_07150 [Mangrovicoccus sp.]
MTRGLIAGLFWGLLVAGVALTIAALQVEARRPTLLRDGLAELLARQPDPETAPSPTQRDAGAEPPIETVQTEKPDDGAAPADHTDQADAPENAAIIRDDAPTVVPDTDGVGEPPRLEIGADMPIFAELAPVLELGPGESISPLLDGGSLDAVLGAVVAPAQTAPEMSAAAEPPGFDFAAPQTETPQPGPDGLNIAGDFAPLVSDPIALLGEIAATGIALEHPSAPVAPVANDPAAQLSDLLTGFDQSAQLDLSRLTAPSAPRFAPEIVGDFRPLAALFPALAPDQSLRLPAESLPLSAGQGRSAPQSLAPSQPKGPDPLTPPFSLSQIKPPQDYAPPAPVAPDHSSLLALDLPEAAQNRQAKAADQGSAIAVPGRAQDHARLDPPQDPAPFLEMPSAEPGPDLNVAPVWQRFAATAPERDGRNMIIFLVEPRGSDDLPSWAYSLLAAPQGRSDAGRTEREWIAPLSEFAPKTAIALWVDTPIAPRADNPAKLVARLAQAGRGLVVDRRALALYLSAQEAGLPAALIYQDITSMADLSRAHRRAMRDGQVVVRLAGQVDLLAQISDWLENGAGQDLQPMPLTALFR